MNIVYLGHAGFLVETEKTVIIMDPWVSKFGAFDCSWFQFPCNHHMDGFIIDKIKNTAKSVYLYISHEHKDHFDAAFLKRLNGMKFRYIIPEFRRTELFDLVSSLTDQEIILCGDNRKVCLNGEDEYVKIYTNDSELNRDSAILYACNGQKFFNMNDCKISDRIETIKQEEGNIRAFACQFSGATWHPVCYDYPPKKYAQVSTKKKLSKFESVALAIERVAPDIYIPSAGPAVFLDPKLIEINFQPHNTFPRNPEVIKFLNKRLKTSKPMLLDLVPGDSIGMGDVIDVAYTDKARVREAEFRNYVLNYASRYTALFEERITAFSEDELSGIVRRLVHEFSDKLDNFPLRIKIQRPLYIEFHDYPDIRIKIDFQSNHVGRTFEKPYGDYYMIKTYSYDIKRVLDGLLTWEDYALTFRMQLNREPDVYQVLMQGFLLLEKEDMNHFCEKILSIQNRTERIVVEVGGCRYSVDRYCPHEGGDLKQAWSEEGRYLVCSRHRWYFDLEDGGICNTNSATINAIPLEEN